MCARDEVIASPSHYFQAGCRGSLSQVEPVRAAGTRGDKGGSLGCDWSSASRASPGAARSAGVGSTPPPPPPRLGRGRRVLLPPRGARAGFSERVLPFTLNALLGDFFSPFHLFVSCSPRKLPHDLLPRLSA